MILLTGAAEFVTNSGRACQPTAARVASEWAGRSEWLCSLAMVALAGSAPIRM